MNSVVNLFALPASRACGTVGLFGTFHGIVRFVGLFVLFDIVDPFVLFVICVEVATGVGTGVDLFGLFVLSVTYVDLVDTWVVIGVGIGVGAFVELLFLFDTVGLFVLGAGAFVEWRLSPTAFWSQLVICRSLAIA